MVQFILLVNISPTLAGQFPGRTYIFSILQENTKLDERDLYPQRSYSPVGEVSVCVVAAKAVLS